MRHDRPPPRALASADAAIVRAATRLASLVGAHVPLAVQLWGASLAVVIILVSTGLAGVATGSGNPVETTLGLGCLALSVLVFLVETGAYEVLARHRGDPDAVAMLDALAVEARRTQAWQRACAMTCVPILVASSPLAGSPVLGTLLALAPLSFVLSWYLRCVRPCELQRR